MEQSRTFINVSPHRAKVRHQHTRGKLPQVKPKRQKKPIAVRSPERTEAYPTPSSLGELAGEESDVEEVPRLHDPSKSPKNGNKPPHATPPDPNSMPVCLYNQKDATKESIHDLFSATGNLDVPYYVKTYQSSQSEVSHVLNYCMSTHAEICKPR
jgi:hypothetical protein